MILVLFLTFFANHPSKIPNQNPLPSSESRKAEHYADNLNNSKPPLAESIANRDGDDKTENQQATSGGNNAEQGNMIRLTFALVVINVAYVFVAFLQWRAIKYQVRMSHRSQLAASPAGVLDLLSGTAPRVQIELKNVGGTTAYHCEYETWIELLPFPFIDFSSQADHVISQEPCALYPQHNPLTINIPFRNGLGPAERNDILDLRRYVCVRVRVTYKDPFKWKRRYASFGFYVQKDGLSFLPKYNDAN